MWQSEDNYLKLITSMVMICNDQEPLNFDLYDYIEEKLCNNSRSKEPPNGKAHSLMDLPEYRNLLLYMNIGQAVRPLWNLNDYFLLLHSEKNSPELIKYEERYFIGVYYWSHAIIARDWFRYAEIDPALNSVETMPDKDFLIYNRAWSGTREYRLKFTELLINSGVFTNCQTKFNPVDQEQHYTKHKFVNENFCNSRRDFESYFEENTSLATASADYTSQDYTNTGIEIVLETLFDDRRIHLTEKSLRPIACGKPFMLASTCGSLEYLKSYGFKTFAPYIDETYDTIQDPLKRLQAIVNEMQRISSLSFSDKKLLYKNLNDIARYNKNRFFSQEFFHVVVDEFKTNFSAALTKLAPERKGRHWLGLRKIYSKQFPEEKSLLANNDHYRSRQDIVKCHLWLKNLPKIC